MKVKEATTASKSTVSTSSSTKKSSTARAKSKPKKVTREANTGKTVETVETVEIPAIPATKAKPTKVVKAEKKEKPAKEKKRKFHLLVVHSTFNWEIQVAPIEITEAGEEGTFGFDEKGELIVSPSFPCKVPYRNWERCKFAYVKWLKAKRAAASEKYNTELQRIKELKSPKQLRYEQRLLEELTGDKKVTVTKNPKLIITKMPAEVEVVEDEGEDEGEGA